MATVADIRNALVQSFERTLEVLEHMDETVEIYPSWKSKELVAHLAGWDRVTADSLASFIQGGVPDEVSINGVDAHNQDSIASYAKMSLGQVLAEWESERQRLLDTMIALEDSRVGATITPPWGGETTVEKMLMFLSKHEARHTDDMIAIIEA